MKHELPVLPYPKNALEPYISQETIEYHHGKHHRAYVTKLNELIRGTTFAEASLEDIVRQAQGDLFNQAAQAWNHGFYWRCLSQKGGGQPHGELAAEIKSAFGSLSGFKKEFLAAVEGQFGSGWVWLVRQDDGRLAILRTANADTPLRTGQVPLLNCDVWEHAYYIDYRNSRAEYLAAFWHVVDWEFAAGNMAASDRAMHHDVTV